MTTSLISTIERLLEKRLFVKKFWIEKMRVFSLCLSFDSSKLPNIRFGLEFFSEFQLIFSISNELVAWLKALT